jgi:hypothetical protein
VVIQIRIPSDEKAAFAPLVRRAERLGSRKFSGLCRSILKASIHTAAPLERDAAVAQVAALRASVRAAHGTGRLNDDLAGDIVARLDRLTALLVPPP